MAEYNKDNIFRKILDGDIPCYKIFETDDCIAILDAFPCVEGHSLLIPKANTVNMLDMDEETAGNYMKNIPRLANIVKKATGCDAVNIASNCGAEAGQMVFHTHTHVIPRFKDDKLLKHPAPMGGMIEKDAADKVLEKMKPHL
eukprot:m.334615 g.334615  ORF g.334615 m.334615 type:complete len:143 (+) comp17398_c0_seq1:27-455(+)